MEDEVIKRGILLTAMVAVASALGFFGALSAASADGMPAKPRHHHHRHYYKTVMQEADAGYLACRTGWWQTVRDGHVRPHWGTYCRR